MGSHLSGGAGEGGMSLGAAVTPMICGSWALFISIVQTLWPRCLPFPLVVNVKTTAKHTHSIRVREEAAWSARTYTKDVSGLAMLSSRRWKYLLFTSMPVFDKGALNHHYWKEWTSLCSYPVTHWDIIFVFFLVSKGAKTLAKGLNSAVWNSKVTLINQVLYTQKSNAIDLLNFKNRFIYNVLMKTYFNAYKIVLYDLYKEEGK